MKLDDYIAFGVFFGFGFWFLLLPNSVIRFYTWFQKGRVQMPKTFGVRLVGALWIVLMSVVMIFSKR